MTFRDRLRKEIARTPCSAKELAARIGVSYSTFLSYIDARGVLPNAEVAVRIAQALGVSVEYLVTGTDPVRDTVLKTPSYEGLEDSLESLSPEELEKALPAVRTLITLIGRSDPLES